MSKYGFRGLLQSGSIHSLLDALSRMAEKQLRKLGLPPSLFDPFWESWDKDACEGMALRFFDAIEEGMVTYLACATEDIDGLLAKRFHWFVIDELRKRAPHVGNLYRRTGKLLRELDAEGMIELSAKKECRIAGGKPFFVGRGELSFDPETLPPWERKIYADETLQISPIVENSDLRAIVLAILESVRGWVRMADLFGALIRILDVPHPGAVLQPWEKGQDEISFEEWLFNRADAHHESPADLRTAIAQAWNQLDPVHKELLERRIQQEETWKETTQAMRITRKRYYQLLSEIRKFFEEHF